MTAAPRIFSSSVNVDTMTLMVASGMQGSEAFAAIMSEAFNAAMGQVKAQMDKQGYVPNAEIPTITIMFQSKGVKQ